MATAHNASPRNSIAGLLLAALAMAVLIIAWGERLSPLASTSFGLNVGDNGAGAYAAKVLSGSSADRAGIKVGDGIDVGDLTQSSRFRLFSGSPPGTQLTVRVAHASASREVVLTAEAQPADRLGLLWWLIAGATITLVIVAFIALRRPSIATTALVLYGCGSLTMPTAAAEFSWISDPWFGGVATFVMSAFGWLPLVALLPFITRFPHPPVTRAATLRMHAADVIFGAAAVVAVATVILEPVSFVSWQFFYNVLYVLIALAMLGFATLAYRDESGESRRRIGWVIAGFLVSMVAYSYYDFMAPGIITNLLSPGVRVITQISQLLTAALPVALAYAVLRHRVLDIGFALNRGAVYAVLTTIVVCFVSLVDWVTARLLSEQRLALAIEALAMIAVGVSLNRLHSRVERVVDRTVFRRRHIAERQIEYRIDALRFASADSTIDYAIAVDAPQILELASAAVFRRVRADGRFERIAASGWASADVESVDPESLLVRTIQAIEKPIMLPDLAFEHAGMPHGAAAPVLAIPINAQHELLGFALYGSERDGGSLDPSQVSLLARLVNAANSAYGVVETRRWRRRAAELEGSLPTANAGASD